MENKDRIKALNILFTATWISLFISLILSLLLGFIIDKSRTGIGMAVISPIITYIIGRILCFKEYKDETT